MKLLQQLKLEFSFLKEVFHFWYLTTKYNASSRTESDIEKMQYTLLRENHTIEKGLSMRSPRKGFGQRKVYNLILRLNRYIDLYADKDSSFLTYPFSTIKNYIEYTKRNGLDIKYIEILFDDMVKRVTDISIHPHAGTTLVSRNEINEDCNRDFKSLLYSRHSIRYFSDKKVSKELIENALLLASRTPSACNRQGWKTHVFVDNQSIELIKWQGGCRGFENEINCSILVTANLKAFLSYEIHQAYIDGGLYAMNLINALHSLGLGTIPLSCGFVQRKLKQLSQFDIPENEVPIVIIGIGHLLDEFKVAVSTRKDVSLTNKFH